MKTKIKEYPLVGFPPTEDYMDTLKKLGFEYVDSNDMCIFFKHKEDNSSLEYFLRGKLLKHIYEFDKYNDLFKKVYDLYRFFKNNKMRPLVVFKIDKTKKHDSKLYIRGIRQMRPYLLEKGKFLLDFSSKRSNAMCSVYKENNHFYFSIFIYNRKYENK
jgi:hypothetical protein